MTRPSRREPGLDRPSLAAAPDLAIPAGDARREPGPPSAAPRGDGREPPAPRRERPWSRASGPAGSLALHLALALLVLFAWRRPAPLAVTQIPVELVFAPPPAVPSKPPPPKPKPVRIEKPKPTPAPKPKPVTKPKPEPKPKPVARTAPPHGPLSSESIGDTNPQDLGKTNRAGQARAKAAPPTPEPPKPKVAKLEEAKPEKPKPAPEPPMKPKPRGKTALAGLPLPLTPLMREKKAVPWPLPLEPAAPHRAERRHSRRREPRRETTRLARYPGPSATRSAYLAYLAMLARRHLGLLPPSVIAGRHGETVLSIQVLDDGTVAMISVAKSSGYPDIDRRVEQMIAAIGRFPPVPQWFQGDRITLKFRLRFPFAVP